MTKQFELTEDHITLLTNTYVTWNDLESGAPSIDPKYPYGERNVAEDILVILGVIQEAERGEVEITDAQEEWAHKLHAETETALQIILQTKSFAPGEYEADYFGTTWKKVSE